MTWESIEAIAAVIAAVVAVFAIWLQNKSFKANLAADLIMKLDDRFTSSEYKEIRSKAARSLQLHIDEKEAEDVFDFFETVGLFTRRKALDAEIVHSFFFHWINVYWNAGRDYILRRQKESKLSWKDFCYLYQKVLEVEKKKDSSSQDISLSAERLKGSLNDEIEISDSNDSLPPDAKPLISQNTEDQKQP
jgi:hypothetical protein